MWTYKLCVDRCTCKSLANKPEWEPFILCSHPRSYVTVGCDTTHRRRQKWRCVVAFFLVSYLSVQIYQLLHTRCWHVYTAHNVELDTNGKIYIFKSVRTHTPTSNTSLFMFCWHICHSIYSFYLLVYCCCCFFISILSSCFPQFFGP